MVVDTVDEQLSTRVKYCAYPARIIIIIIIIVLQKSYTKYT